MNKLEKKAQIVITVLNGVFFLACVGMFLHPEALEKARIFFGFGAMLNGLGFINRLLAYLDGRWEIKEEIVSR